MSHKTILIGLIGIFMLINPLYSQTWGGARRLTFTFSESRNPAIAVDSNNHIHVVWDEVIKGNREIYYKKSTNSGVTWTTKRLTYSSGESWSAVIAVDSNDHIHVAWMDETPGNAEIYYKKSTTGGGSWMTRRLTYNVGESFFPSIAVDSNNHIYVAWDDDSVGNSEIYFKKSTNGGAAWTTKRLTYSSYNSWYADIATDPNNDIGVVWQNFTPGGSEIYFKKSTNAGVNWTTKRLTFISGYSRNPAIAMDSSNDIYVVWDDEYPGNREIFCKKSTDGGTTWTAKRLTYNSGDSKEPAIAIDSHNYIHVVWMDLTPPNYEIFYKRSTDAGGTWGGIKRLTWTSGHSEFPSIATDSSGKIFVVWQDLTHGAAEILYKIGIQWYPMLF